MQSISIIGEAVKGDLPGGILHDACVELVDVICVVPGSPFDSQDGNLSLLLRGLLVVALPGSDFDGSEARVLRLAILARILDNLLPGVLDGFLLFT